MSHCRTPAFNNHLDYCFIVFENLKQGAEVRRFFACDNVIHNRTHTNFPVILSLRFGLGVGALRFIAHSISRRLIVDLSARPISLCLGVSRRMQYFYHQIPGIRLPQHKWPTSWSNFEDQVVPLERNLYGHPLAGLLWERQFEKVLLELGLFLSVYVDDLEDGRLRVPCGRN